MRKTVKKAFAALLAAVLVFAAVPAVTAQEQTPELYGELVLDTAVDVRLYNGGDVAYLSFTAPETDVYTLMSESDHDTWGDLYDSQWNLLATHGMETSDWSYDFRINYELTAGETYYLRVRMNSDVAHYEGWDEFLVWVEKWEPAAVTLELGVEGKVNVPRQQYRYFTFTPAESGVYFFTGEDCAQLYDSKGACIETAEQNLYFSDFIIGRELTAGETYYLKVYRLNPMYYGNMYVTVDTFTEEPGGTFGDGITWSLVDGVLTVSGTGEMDFGESEAGGVVDAPWYEYCTYIKEAVIEEGITTVFERAFFECEELEKVTLPSTLTVIGEQAFYGCGALKSVNLPDGLTELQAYAFQDCVSLTEVILPAGLETSDRQVFDGCTSLTHVELAAREEALGAEMFANCTALTEIVIPEGYTYIASGAFSGCTGLTDVTIPEGVTDLYAAFSYCSALEHITLPESLDDLDSYEFSGCTALKSVHLSKNVCSIGDSVFFGCFSLEAVTVDEENPYHRDLDGVLYTKDLTTLEVYPYAKEGDCLVVPATVTQIKNFAVYGQKKYSYYGDYYVHNLKEIRFLGDAFSLKSDNTGIIRTFFYVFLTEYYPDTWSDGIGWCERVNDMVYVAYDRASYQCEHEHEEGGVCLVCGEVLWVNLCPDGHTWEDATCETPKTCSVCGATEGEALGHAPGEAVVENEIAATCTEDGGYDEVCYCTACGSEVSRVHTVLEATGHKEADPVQENYTAPTPEADGGYDEVIYCAHCGEEMSRSHVTVEYVEPVGILGDVNGDGYVDSDDAALILKYDVGLIDELDETLGDVNGDGYVDSDDAALILKYDVGLIEGF